MTDTKFMSQLPPRARSQLCSSASGPAPAAVSERQAWNSGCQVPKVIPPTGVGPGWGGGGALPSRHHHIGASHQLQPFLNHRPRRLPSFFLSLTVRTHRSVATTRRRLC